MKSQSSYIRPPRPQIDLRGPLTSTDEVMKRFRINNYNYSFEHSKIYSFNIGKSNKQKHSQTKSNLIKNSIDANIQQERQEVLPQPKDTDNQNLQKQPEQLKNPNIVDTKFFNKGVPFRSGQTAALLNDHIYLFGGNFAPEQSQKFQGIPKEATKDWQFCCINLKNYKWHVPTNNSSSIQDSESLQQPIRPCKRDNHGMAVFKNQIYVFGGSNDSKYFNDLWSFNNFTNEWRKINPKGEVVPKQRDPTIFLSYNNEFLLCFGGLNIEEKLVFKDIYMFKDDQWKRIKGPTELPQQIKFPYKMKACFCNNRVYMIGGINQKSGQYIKKLYELTVNVENLTAQIKPVEPNIKQIQPDSARISHQLIAINNQYFILIGGYQPRQKIYYQDIWVFDTLMKRWFQIEPKNGPIQSIWSFSTVMYHNMLFIIGGLIYSQGNSYPSDEISALKFAQQEIFQAELCQQCTKNLQSSSEKKDHNNSYKKAPRNLSMSMGFLYNLAQQIKHPFHAISMLYDASEYLNAKNFSIQINKNLSDFDYIDCRFDGNSFKGRADFVNFLSLRTESYSSDLFKKFIENIKLASFRLGKTFLLVSSDKKYRYVILMSSDSRIAPHCDESYVYFAYSEDLVLQRYDTQEGVRKRNVILNFLKSHLSNPQIVLSLLFGTSLMIFENKVIMNGTTTTTTHNILSLQNKESDQNQHRNNKPSSRSQPSYTYELVKHQDEDIKVYKNQNKINFLEERGYQILNEVEISLSTFMSLYHFNPNYEEASKQDLTSKPTRFKMLNQESPLPFIPYNSILQKFHSQKLIKKLSTLPKIQQLKIQGSLYYTQDPQLIRNNFGILIYSNGRLFTRYQMKFGQLFIKHFYKSKYKQAKTIFHQLGSINIEGLKENTFKSGFYRSELFNYLEDEIERVYYEEWNKGVEGSIVDQEEEFRQKMVGQNLENERSNEMKQGLEKENENQIVQDESEEKASNDVKEGKGQGEQQQKKKKDMIEVEEDDKPKQNKPVEEVKQERGDGEKDQNEQEVDGQQATKKVKLN